MTGVCGVSFVRQSGNIFVSEGSIKLSSTADRAAAARACRSDKTTDPMARAGQSEHAKLQAENGVGVESGLLSFLNPNHATHDRYENTMKLPLLVSGFSSKGWLPEAACVCQWLEWFRGNGEDTRLLPPSPSG